MGVQGKLENVGKAALLRAASAPILTCGQLVIAGMKLTTGLGEPEDGARFGRGGARLHGVAATLMSARPTESWSKDDEAVGPGRGDGSRLTTPIAVTVNSENPIGPPPAPGP